VVLVCQILDLARTARSTLSPPISARTGRFGVSSAAVSSASISFPAAFGNNRANASIEAWARLGSREGIIDVDITELSERSREAG
jgi:hypothetical protein